MESGTLEVAWIPIGDVFCNPANPRLNDEAVPHVAASIRRFGWRQPIVAKPSGEVIAGNTRLKAAESLGMETVPVVRFEGSEIEAAAFAIADNRTAEFAQWDEPALARLLEELRTEDALDGVGYSAEEIDTLLAELEADTGLDLSDEEPPEPPEDPVTRRGDLWLCGKHRVLCGDSGSVEDVDRLLNGAKIHLVNTDPPYNVKVEPRSNNAIAAGNSSFKQTHHQKLDLARHPEKAKPTHRQMRAKDRPLINDFVSDEEFDRLLQAWFGNISRVLEPGGSFYIWGGYANLGNYPPVLEANELYFSQGIVWNKCHPVLTRKDFMGAFELAFYGWREGAGHKFYGPNNVTDLWEVQKISPQQMVHLTEKSVELAVRAIQYSSRPGENVLDLFGGSGSTMMGCEQTGRRAFLMELDRAYTDVIVTRWQNATGKDATLESTGQVFDEVAGDRA